MEKNYNSGGVVSHETAKDARTAQLTLDDNGTHSSLLEVLVVKCPTEPAS